MRRATPFVALTVVASVLFLPGQSGIATATCAAAPTAMRAGAQGAPAHVSPARPVRETPRVVNATHYSLRSLRFKGQAVRVLSFTGGQGYGLKQFLTRDHFYNRAGVALSRQLRPLAIAGTSGDFNTTLGPKHAYELNGILYGTGTQPGSVLYMDKTGDQAWIGPRHITINAWAGGEMIPVTHLNVMGYQGCGTTVAFSAKGITPWVHPIAGLPSTLLSRVSATTGATTQYVVQEQSDRAILPTGDELVLAGAAVRSLAVGAPVTVKVSYYEPAEIWQAIGGMPQIVQDGKNIGQTCNPKGCGKKCPGCSHYCTLHTCDAPLMALNPRDVIGISQGCSDEDPSTPCTYYIVTVDGRLPDWSPYGLQFPGLAQLMIQLGAWNAINLDGGGSTELMTRSRTPLCYRHVASGCIVNHPSQGGRERGMSISVQLVPT